MHLRPNIPVSDWARLQAAKNRLSPPPFLVSAVIESLLDSEYADRTWVVDGEADGFCAAAAYEQARGNNPRKGIAIFTNDSDLVRITMDTNPPMYLNRDDAATQYFLILMWPLKSGIH